MDGLLTCLAVCLCVCLVGYTMDVMYFETLNNPIQIDENLQLPQFKIIDQLTHDCSQNYTTGHILPTFCTIHVYRLI